MNEEYEGRRMETMMLKKSVNIAHVDPGKRNLTDMMEAFKLGE